MGIGSIWHWLIVLVIVLLLFGTKRLRNVGGDLGEAIKNFRKSMRDGEEEKPGATDKLANQGPRKIIEGEATKEKDKV
jgi:sec-independent protein translocase protein TatA